MTREQLDHFKMAPFYFEYVLKYAMVKAGVVTDSANRILSFAVKVGISQNAKKRVKNKYITLFLNMENPMARGLANFCISCTLNFELSELYIPSATRFEAYVKKTALTKVTAP